jgi:hypothetical protein
MPDRSGSLTKSALYLLSGLFHADDYGGDENYETEHNGHGSPQWSRGDSGRRVRGLPRPLGHGAGTSCSKEPGCALFHGRPRLCYGAWPGTGATSGHYEVLLAQLYLVGVNNLAKSKLSGALRARAARRPAANGVDGRGWVERQQLE